MKRFLLYLVAFFLLPFYPLIKRGTRIGDKIRFGEIVVVVIRNKNKKKVYIT